MGGFTRPRDLRSSNWFLGGRYATIGKAYELPPKSAYEPHTVYLLESRYPIKHGLGRVDCYDHVVGVCREGDFEAVLRRYNSVRAPRTELEAMDNARWPWGPQYQLKRTKWWGPHENPRDIIKEIFGDEGSPDSYIDDTGTFEEFEEEVEAGNDDSRQLKVEANVEEEKLNPKSLSVESSTLVASIASAPSSVDQKRTFHSSTRAYAIPTPGEAPNFTSERRSQHHDKQTAAVAERVQQEDHYTIYAHTHSIPPHIGGSITTTKFPKHGKAPKSRHARLSPPTPIPSNTNAIREQYLPTLAETPFWRPLLSLTLSTRPLALTLARLSRSLPRGLPFYSSICNDDRKTHASYSARIQCMRIDRMEDLTVQIAQLLAGARGGFIGVRFSTQEKGRGIGGEGLEAPLPKDKRTIKVGVGNWYHRAEEVKEAFREDAIARVGEVGVGLKDIGETFDISGLDDYGKRIDDNTGEVIPWRKSEPLQTADFTKEYQRHMKQLDSEIRLADDDKNLDFAQVSRNENQMRRARKLRRQELARSYKYEIASQLAQQHRSVTGP